MVEYLPRLAEPVVEAWLERGKAVVLVGPRQAGKTTLLKHLSEKHGWEYLTLEDPGILRELHDIKSFARLHGGILLIDEAQYVKDIGRRLKYLYDVEGRRFVASGSGSFDIKIKVSGELVGRAARVELLPLSFSEFVLWKDKKVFKVYREAREAVKLLLSGRVVEPDISYSSRLQELWEEYVIFGGYPEAVLSREREEILKNILASYIDRDVVGFLGIREYTKFMRLITHVAAVLTTPFVKSTAQEFAGISHKTLETYLSILERSYIVFEVQPLPTYSHVKKAVKIYFYDNGLMNLVGMGFMPFAVRQDNSKLLENFVARHLLDHGRPFYYRATGEVDFVVNGIPVEAKMGDRASRALYALKDKLKSPHAIVVRPGPFEEKRGIYYVPPWFL